MSAKVLGGALVGLAAVCALVWYAALHEDRGRTLSVSFLNVGEGDAIFIDAPSGNQVLIDGGPDTAVLRGLSREMPFYDRSIDVVIPTHPDADHVTGLIDVLERYRVKLVMRSSVEGSTDVWRTLEQDIQRAKERGTTVLTAERGQIIDLGSGAYLEVLSPDRLVPRVSTNEGCIVTRLVYGNTAFLFDCDAPQSIEKYLVSLDGRDLHADVLKAGHHGSKTSSSPLFVGFVHPTYAVFSRGCNNRYGFPNKETVDLFKTFHITTEDTCTEGTVTFVSDGTTVTLGN